MEVITQSEYAPAFETRILGDVKPGLTCVSLYVDGQFVQACIGSGPSARDAKACALRNARRLVAALEAMSTEDGLVGG